MKNRYLLITGIIAVSALSLTRNSENTVSKLLAKHKIQSSGGQAGLTGAPGENNCTQCHVGTVLNGTSENILTILDGVTPVTEVVPGQTYTVALQMNSNPSKKGFSATVLDENNDMAGTFTGNLATGGTQDFNNAPQTRQYVSHTSTSNTSAQTSWIWTWTAPVGGGNTFTFYIATNSADGNAMQTNDNIYLSTHTILSGCANSGTTSSLTASSCDSYTSPSGAVYTSSQVFDDIIPNSVGCDSTITIDLTINNSTFSNLSAQDCNSYTLNGQTYNSTGTYTQVVTNSEGCDSTITLDLIIPSSTTFSNSICAVGVNNGNNRVVWEKPITTGIDSFYVYKETAQAGTYERIGGTAYADSALFTDLNSNPSTQAYRYKISSIDTCQNESLLSSEHKTIHLTISQGVGQDWNLIWSHYEGFNFTTYDIYRGTDPNNMSLLTSIQNTLNSYTDQSAPGGNIFYQIVAVNPNGCDPSKAADYASSKSNVADTETSGLDELMFLITAYPNPAKDEVTLSIEPELLETEFTITDNAGRIVLVDTFKALNQKVDLSVFENGVYFISVKRESQPTKIVKQ